MSTATKVLKVEMNKSNDNPFYGLGNCLTLYQNAGKGSVDNGLLDRCWQEVKDDKQKREMFFALLFSIGDVTARQHNIFRKNKVDSGGSSQREAFRKIMDWMKERNYPQFRQFLFARLFNEFTSFDSILANRVTTKKKTKQVTSVIKSLSGSKDYVNDLAQFVADIIKGNNPSDKYFVAKFLTRPRLSKRKKHKVILPQTIQVMKQREFFLKLVSLKAGLRFLQKDKHIEFHGYTEWRKQYIGELESVLFSQKKVLEFDKQQFFAWLEKLPASARYRVRCRLLDKDNKPKKDSNVWIEDFVDEDNGEVVSIQRTTGWGELPKWFLEWEKFKESKQTEVRVIEEQLRQDTTRSVAERTELEAKLATTKKQAKVTTGAIDFASMFSQIITGNIDMIKVQPFLDKITLPYNNLVFIDDSSSMMSNRNRQHGFTAFDFAAFIATIMLIKNPDDSGRSLMGFYSRECRMFQTMNISSRFSNSIVRPTTTKVNEPLIKPEEHFLDNLQRMRAFSHALKTGNGTNISSIPDYIYQWVAGDVEKIEMLQNFPVWTIITDGNWNNLGSAEASINDFMMKCQRYFGYKPYIIAIDAAGDSSAAATRFQGIENLMYVSPNPAQIEQLLTNFRDMDIMDVYTPLQSFYRSNRYDLVKANVL